MGKEKFLKIHHALIEKYLDENPKADSAEAYNATADAAGDEYVDEMETAADLARDIAKDKWH